MKKNLIIITLILIISANLKAQLKEGDGLLGPSIGFWASPNVPTLGMNYEHQLSQLGDAAVISLGGVFRYSTFKNYYPDRNYYNNSYITFGMQSNLNFNKISEGKFVPFIGLVLGYNYISRNGSVYDVSYSSGFWLWGQAGMRYFFSPRVAGSLRFGAGNFNFNVIELGIDFKL